ncbi:tetratricopeptide repeat protein [Shewanella sp. 1_MG-2023]|uniref:tetratricopeptide repeat protein n=1 Tax=unclassified Shewanella TaxID=196818 RepID=UPI0026E20532|nr:MULTISPECIES: tetratricopeptide repeat protein [unclassified Shewanella]MDO6610579.1 tetratricopeptide repeat protein [Shewanella sp. 7_MG-2023]MDO6770704.1 tetratricopeptide repeat protein [Shewanella sp. 2_MG-2023]MDO6793278.1 tetratricopeptide repeat protein [Shewanella sp. 1_MG-2023]
MSVINKVLKDLDKQKQHSASTTGETSDSGFVKPELQFTSQVEANPSDEQSSRKGMYMSIVMFIAVFLIGFMFYRQGVQLKNLQPLTEATQEEAEQPLIAGLVDEVTLTSDDLPDSITDPITDNESHSESHSVEINKTANSLAKSDNDFNEESEVSADVAETDLARAQNLQTVAVEAEPQANKSVVKVDSKNTSVTVKDTLAPSLDDKDNGSVKVRFAQNTRTSTIVEDVKADVGSNSRAAKSSKAEQAIVSNTNAATTSSNKGVMAVKEVILTDAELAQKKFEIAEVAEQQQKIDKAVKYYYEALILEPSMHQARKQLASLYYALNNLGRAEQILAQGVQQFPEEIELAILKAKVENASFSPMKALDTLEAISDNSDWARDKWILQSDIAQKNSRYELAESAYRSLITIEPSQARWWMGLAYALDSQQQYSQAADAYTKALSYRGLSTGAMTYIEQRLIQLGGSQ